MLVLSLVSWILVGLVAAWFGKVLGSEALGWIGLGIFGIAGAIAGGVMALGASGAFAVGVIGSAIGAATGVFIRGAAEEIRSAGPGLAS